MDFDLVTTLDEMNRTHGQQPTHMSMAMQSLIASGPSTNIDSPQPYVWNGAPDLSAMPLADMLDMHANPQTLAPHHHRVGAHAIAAPHSHSHLQLNQPQRQEQLHQQQHTHQHHQQQHQRQHSIPVGVGSRAALPQHANHMSSDLVQGSMQQPHSHTTINPRGLPMVNRKRRYTGNDAGFDADVDNEADVDDDDDDDDDDNDVVNRDDNGNVNNDGIAAGNEASEYVEESSACASVSAAAPVGQTTNNPQHPPPPKLPAMTLNDPLEIDPNVVCQIGGLPYADLCKERAREAFKEAKKNEHLANGNLDRMKRRKKNDTSMTARQKYVRRLRMNQDSAAAARHAQEVYVKVLEKLVKTSEAEKKSFVLEMQQIRLQNEHLQRKVQDLQCKVRDLEDDLSANQPIDTDEQRRTDPAFAKILDLLKGPTSIGAQADMGVQPARAV